MTASREVGIFFFDFFFLFSFSFLYKLGYTGNKPKRCFFFVETWTKVLVGPFKSSRAVDRKHLFV